jgi:4-amino-4-deoxy-L-arabinose transferase-like glycosyltransferase
MKSASRLLAAALLAGLALRICLLLAPTAPLATKALEPTGDSPEYMRPATNLVHGHGFSQDSVPPFRPDILRTPVYPLFLSLPLAVFGSSPVWPVLLQISLSLVTIWLTRKLALELGLGPGTSAFAALLVALSPNLIFYSIKLTTETLFASLLLVALVLINRFRALHRWQELLASGACCGLLILTRPIAAFFPLVIAAYLLWLEFRVRNWQLGIRNSVLLLACASIVVAPWVIRNQRVAGRYIISTVFDYNISVHTAALTLATDKLIPLNQARDSMVARAQAQFGPLDTSDQASYWAAMGKVGWQQALARPLLAAKLHAAGSIGGLLMPLSVRSLRVFSGAHREDSTTGHAHVAQQTIQLVARGKAQQALALIWKERLARMPAPALAILTYAFMFHVILLVSCVVGLFLRRSRGLLWLLLPVIYFTLLTGPVGEARFRVPIEPLLSLFAAVALTRRPKTSSYNPQGAHAV